MFYLQVWMASFLLCDFIISNSSLFTSQYILELGSGTGISSILLASLDVAGVFCTGKFDLTLLGAPSWSSLIHLLTARCKGGIFGKGGDCRVTLFFKFIITFQVSDNLYRKMFWRLRFHPKALKCCLKCCLKCVCVLKQTWE